MKTKLNLEEQMKRQAHLAYVRKVAAENERRFDQMFDRQPAVSVVDTEADWQMQPKF